MVCSPRVELQPFDNVSSRSSTCWKFYWLLLLELNNLVFSCSFFQCMYIFSSFTTIVKLYSVNLKNVRWSIEKFTVTNIKLYSIVLFKHESEPTSMKLESEQANNSQHWVAVDSKKVLICKFWTKLVEKSELGFVFIEQCRVLYSNITLSC